MSDILETVVTEAVTQNPGEAQPTQDAAAQTNGQTQEGRKSYGDWRDQIPKTLWDKVDRDQLPPKLGEHLEAYLSSKTAREELEKLKSTAITPPGDEADEAAWNEYYKRLGRPDTPDGYELARGEGDGKNDKLDALFKDMFHKNGLSKAQGEKFFREFLDYGKTQLSAIQEAKTQAKKAAEESIRKEWGRDYDAKMDEVHKAGSKIFGADTWSTVVESGLSNNPAFVKGLQSVSKAFSEDRIVDGAAPAETSRPGVNSYGDWGPKQRR